MTTIPRTGCSVVALREGKVLLIKRGKEPYKGYWSLPGGAQELGETLMECAQRELKEETGLEAGELKFAAVRDRISRNESQAIMHHYVLASFFANNPRGEAVAADDALAVRWCSIDEMHDLQTTPDTPEFIKAVLAEFS